MKLEFTIDGEHQPLLTAFARVSKCGGFTRAASELGMSTSALSQKVRRLEAATGVWLLFRMTRRVELTEAGRTLLERIEPALQELSAAHLALDEIRGRPAGRLRISATGGGASPAPNTNSGGNLVLLQA